VKQPSFVRWLRALVYARAMVRSSTLAVGAAVLLGAMPAEAAPRSGPRVSSYSRRPVTSLALGPTVYGERSVSGLAKESFWRPGVALQLASRFPLGGGGGFGLRFAWGLTEFERFTRFTDAGHCVGAWTTQAYKDVWAWSGKTDFQPFRAMAGLYGMLFLVMPYVAAGAVYALAPLAPTTFLELDATATYELGDDEGGAPVPYVGGGLGFVGAFHPRTAVPFAGLGPTTALGMRWQRFDASVRGTWLPPYLHSEGSSARTSVLLGTFAVGMNF